MKHFPPPPHPPYFFTIIWFLNKPKTIITFLFFLYAVCGYSQNTVSFNYTGNAQYWTVPDCVFSLSVEAMGAKGGCTNGGKGAKVNGTVLVTPGQILQINVGGMGGYISAGWNGGGLGETGTTSSCGGGGATDIRTGAYTLTDRKIVASGGGGMGGGNTQSMGGHGGCTLGQDGFSSWGKGGYGATQSYGGNGGVGWIGGVTGSNGVLGVGGDLS